ncbi:hypothetical protein N7508_007722 [Penicillium antarcticum]|uniref:uncharacterized protein n=1 Tax=Penicillium antarcticum TaxID=416450 RepID=UPI002392ADC8|nr:uncharacterized protein N7508_007722 [Penicillium antarcticum]KAJ5297473.1 hypothetical protein N7508_007722 [Penicillium antarcticum]
MNNAPAAVGTSPFSNLDIWCDWTGDPNDAVDVSIAIEAWCTPNIRLPVFNIHSPYMIGGPTFSIVPKNNPKSESKRTDADTGARADGASDTTRPFTDSPVTPTHPAKQKGKGKGKKAESDSKSSSKFDRLFDRDGDSGAFSGAESLILSPELPELTKPVDIGVLYTQANTSLSDFLTPSKLPNSRKRTAKAASLPDSIPDEDRDVRYDGDGDGHRPVKPERASPRPSVPSVDVFVAQVPSDNSYNSSPSRLPRPIRIPRQASLDDIGVLPENVPLPTDSAPVSAAEFRRHEGGAPFQRRPWFWDEVLPREDAPEEDAQQDDEEGVFDAWASLGPHDKDYSTRTPLADEKEQKLDAFSTIVSPGNSSRFGGKQDSAVTYGSDGSSGHEDGDAYGVPLARLFTPRISPVPDSNAGAQLIIIGNLLYVQTSLTLSPAIYQLSVTVSLQVRQGQKDWWEVVLTGLPRLRPDEYGYLYFRTPLGQGIEFRTTGFKRNKVAENYLIAQFMVTQRLVVPFRVCDAQFYGFLKDFKVNHLIQSEVKENDIDPLSYIVSYRAMCSIELIQRDFWAEKCSFNLYIHGGPDGVYTGTLLPDQTSLQTIKLDTCTDMCVGNCQVRVTCPRSCLSMFMLAWETSLPYHAAVSWTPQIKTTSLANEAEMKLQLEFAQIKPESSEVEEVEEANPVIQDVVPHREPVVRFVEHKKPNSSRIVQGLWVIWDITSFIFQLIVIMASLTIIYSCSLRKSPGFLSPISGGYTLHCLHQRSFPDIPAASVNFAPQEWPVMETLQVEDFKTEFIESETVDSKTVQPEPTQTKTGPTISSLLSMRDRVDYLLGWRGPI